MSEEQAIVIHASLSTPSPLILEELRNRLGGVEIVQCFEVRDVKKDLEQLRKSQAIGNILLLIHPEEQALRIALLTRFLIEAFEGVLTIVSVDEHWDRKQGAFVQKISEIYLG